MHTYKLAGISLVVLAGVAGLPARSADGAPATSSAPAPRLYTNADLAKFGPPAPTTAPGGETAPMDDTRAWAFVQAVLDREAARLQAERRLALEFDARYPSAPEGFPVDSGYLPGYYPGYYGYGHDFGCDRDFRFGDRVRSNRGFTEGLIPRGHHGRYTFLKGADVVPGPKSPSYPSGGNRGGRGHQGSGGRGGGRSGGGHR